MKYRTTALTLTALLCNSALGYHVPTAQEYAHSLEYRFTNGESAASIRGSLATNGLFTFAEILPHCYTFEADTNNLEMTIAQYKMKLAFVEALLPRYYRLTFLSTNNWNSSLGKIFQEEDIFQQAIIERYEANPSVDNYNYWKALYPKTHIGMYSGPAEPALLIMPSTDFATTAESFVNKLSGIHFVLVYTMLDNFGNHDISRESLYAELSTNTQFRADELFRHCLVDKGDFSTNNIAIAEKQVWRNNFVLEIARHSCNLHTNDANRVLDSTYRDKLETLCSHYTLAPADSLGMTSSEKAEWLARLQATIYTYTNAISPFSARPAL